MPEGPPSPTGPVTATVTPDGGNVDAVALDGTRFVLDVPANALFEPVEITLDPDGGMADALASAILTPADTVFHEPATLSVVFPLDQGVPDDAVLALGEPGDLTYVETSVAPAARRLSTSQRLFGLPELPATPLRTAQGSGGGSVAALTARCQNLLDSAQISLDGMLATNSYERALRLKLSTAALAAQCSLEPEAVAWVDDLAPIACARYEDLALIAETFVADTYDTFVELLAPLVNWATQMENLAVTCPTATPLPDLILAKYSQFITFYSSVVADASGQTFEEILDEVNKVWTLRGRAEVLGATDAETLLETAVLFPLMDLLRDRAYTLCVNDDDHYYLSSLLEAIFTTRRVPIGTVLRSGGLTSSAIAPQSSHAAFGDRDIQADLQVCASQADVEVWADPAVPYEVTAQARSLDGGTSPGGGTLEVDTLAPYEGYLVLRGDVAAFRCGQSRSLEDDQLVFEFDGREADRVSASGGTMLGSPVELDVTAMAQSASFSPDALNTGDLVFIREGGACSGTYGPTRADVFTVHLTIDPAPTTSSVTASPTTIRADTETPVTFDLAFADRGENLDRLAVTLSLQGADYTFDVDLDTAPEVQGFDVATGTGTYSPSLLVYCSELGKNPLEARFELVDAFDQRSSQISTTLTVDYGGC